VPLATLAILFYTITIDFIVLLITDKFTKRILLITGNET